MKSCQSENLAREWKEDGQAPDVWDALQLMEVDPQLGLGNLQVLAEGGSSIGAMYLGHIYMTGQYGVNIDRDLGEDWLQRSANMGSIEGCFRLAKYMHADGRDSDAVVLYKQMSDRGYMPANFILGVEYSLGEAVEKDAELSFYFFRKADAAGHLHARHWVSHILMKDGSVLSWFRGILKKIVLFIPMMYYSIKYPNSDRLRR